MGTGQCIGILTARLYEGMNLTSVKGLTAAQHLTLRMLGAVDHSRPSTSSVEMQFTHQSN
jgi:hypothetical protein